jgi:hypothetical protein
MAKPKKLPGGGAGGSIQNRGVIAPNLAGGGGDAKAVGGLGINLPSAHSWRETDKFNGKPPAGNNPGGGGRGNDLSKFRPPARKPS